MNWFLTIIFIFLLINSSYTQETCPDNGALRNVSAHFNFFLTSYTEYESNISLYQLENNTIIHVIKANVSVLCKDMIDTFPYLQHLALTNANISKIEPEPFRQVPKLTTLSLAVNHLTTVKRNYFKNLEKLKVLYLSANKIEVIEDDAFADLVNLRKIYLDKNSIFEINSKWFVNNPNLGLINLAFNRISKVQSGAFTQQNAKLEIRLQQNAIEELEPMAVVTEMSKEIKPKVTMRLDYNTLTRIPSGFITSMASFTSFLSLNFNVVDCVSEDVMEELKNTLIEVELKKNPINCNCMLNISNFLNTHTLQANFKYSTNLDCVVYGIMPSEI